MGWGRGYSRIEPKYGNRRVAFAARLLATSALVAVYGYALQPVPAASQTSAGQADAARTFNIPAQPLASALNALGRQSGLQVTLASSTSQGVTSRPVNGRFTPQQALAQMLEGTGIPFRITSERTAVVGRQASVDGGALPPGAIQLDQIEVQGAGNPNALIGNLPPEYPGGQVARGGQVGILGNRDMMNTPFSQTSYTSKTIENQQARSVGDVVNNDPAVQVTNQSAGFNDISIRGFAVRADNILFNGLQGFAPGYLDSVMTESVERVEILRGPSSLLNGMVGNVGGAINIVPKRAGDEPLTQITPDYTMNSQSGGHVDIGRRFGDKKEFGIRINGVYRNGDAPINHQSREQRLATLAFDYRGDRFRFAADLGYQQQRVQGLRRFTFAAAGIQIPRAPDNRTNWFDPAEFSDAAVYYGAFRAEYDLSDHWTAFVAAGGNVREQRRVTGSRTIINSEGDLAAGSIGLGWSANKLYQNTVESGIRGTFDTGPIRHQVVLAGTYDYQDTRVSPGLDGTPFPASNIYNPVFGPPPDLSTLPGYGSVKEQNNSTLSSVVVADTLSILQERVQLTVGARLQKIEATDFDVFGTGAVISSYKEKALTPSVGLVIKPWENVSLYANYIQGLQRGPQAPPGTANAGQVFAPYKAEQYETGVKVDFGSLAATLALYQIALPNAYIDPSTNVFGLNGEQRNRGVEFNVFGEITSGVRLLGGISYIDSVLIDTAGGIDDGNRGIAVPAWRAVLGAEWDTPFIPGFTLTGRVIRNDSVFINTANTQSIPAWTRLDIGARYRIERPDGHPIVIRAGIDNVLNSSHWEAAGNILILNEPRTFKLSASFNF